MLRMLKRSLSLVRVEASRASPASPVALVTVSFRDVSHSVGRKSVLITSISQDVEEVRLVLVNVSHSVI